MHQHHTSEVAVHKRGTVTVYDVTVALGVEILSIKAPVAKTESRVVGGLVEAECLQVR